MNAQAVVIPDLVRQHAEDAAILHLTRSTLTHAPHVKLAHLRRFDERLAAHLDGLAVAAEHAWPFIGALLAAPSSGAVFTALVRAILEKKWGAVRRLFALHAAMPEVGRGVISAFGWVEPGQLRGVVRDLLVDPEPMQRVVGIAACGIHRVDPGVALVQMMDDPSSIVRARAFRAAAEIGRPELLSTCAAGTKEVDTECRLWAAWSAVLLGDRNRGVSALNEAAQVPGVQRERAYRLLLQASTPQVAHGILERLASEPSEARLLIRGCGLAGDPSYVPWLIAQMADPALARAAGEAFSLITGIDLIVAGLDGDRAEGFEGGPTDSPDDEDVDMDADDGLPWPQIELVGRWWSANAQRFQDGSRYFVGAPVTHSHCIEVLKDGFQRQRSLAASYLCLLEPGTSLFNTSAPAWRQRRLLAQMS